MTRLALLILLSLFVKFGHAQAVEEDKLGAWYMYFYNAKFGDGPFGIQGDFQFRFWDFGSDLEQILIRNGLTYKPANANITFTIGYGSITSGVPGESSDRSHENRIYQEALFPQKMGSKVYLTHRARYEQRWADGQDFRTRYRYNLFINIPLNAAQLGQGTLYAALYNEIFINGQKKEGRDRFDRNRTYLGLGYGIRKNLRVQIGAMNQTTASWSKWQAQLSAHHAI